MNLNCYLFLKVKLWRVELNTEKYFFLFNKFIPCIHISDYEFLGIYICDNNNTVQIISTHWRQLLEVLVVNTLFLKYNFTSNQSEAFLIDSFSRFLIFICLHAVDINQNLNRKSYRLHCIDIIAYHCIWILTDRNRKEKQLDKKIKLYNEPSVPLSVHTLLNAPFFSFIKSKKKLWF